MKLYQTPFNKDKAVNHEKMSQENAIVLFDYLSLLKKRLFFIVIVTFLSTLSAVVYSLVSPKIYRAEAVIMPMGESQGGGQLGSLLGGQLGGVSLGGLLGGQNATSKLVTLLESRTLAENVIQHLDLQKFLYSTNWDSQTNSWKDGKIPSLERSVETFRGMTSLVDDRKKDSMIIYVTSQDPQMAVTIADEILNELQRLINQNEYSDAKRQRVFIEKRLVSTRRDLINAGKEIAEYYKGNNISPLSAIVDVPIDVEGSADWTSIPGLTASIDSTMQNLDEQKEKLEDKYKNLQKVEDVPQQVYLDYLAQKKLMLNSLTTLLSQQYEMAKIAELKETISFQVIDRARFPEKKFKPKRRQIVIAGFVVSLFASSFFALFMEYIKGLSKLKRGNQVV